MIKHLLGVLLFGAGLMMGSLVHAQEQVQEQVQGQSLQGESSTLLVSYTLSELARLALESDHDYQIAQDQIAIDEENVAISASSLLPQVSLSFSTLRVNEEDAGKTTSLELSQSILNVTSYYNYQRADKEYQAKQIDFKLAKHEVLGQVVSLYFAIKLANEHVELGERQIEETTQRWDKNKRLFRAGKITRTDLLAAEAALSNLSVEQLTRRSNYYDLLDRMYDLTGAYPEIAAQLTDRLDLQNLYDATIEALDKSAKFSGNLQVQQGYYNLEAAQALAEAADLFYIPDAQLGISRSHNSLRQETSDTVQLRAGLALFSGGKRFAERRQAILQVQLVNERYLQVQQQNSSMYRSLRRDLMTEYLKIAALEDSLRSNLAVQIGVERGYDAGKYTIDQVLQAVAASYQSHYLLRAQYYQIFNLAVAIYKQSGNLDVQVLVDLQKNLPAN